MTNNEFQKRYTWKNSYHLPMESYWSIETKFCTLNAIGREKYKKQKEIQAITRESQWSEYFGPYYSRQGARDVGYFRVCPICFSLYGYHSMLHQNDFFTNCFVHKKSRLVRFENREGFTPTDISAFAIKVIQSEDFGNTLAEYREKLCYYEHDACVFFHWFNIQKNYYSTEADNARTFFSQRVCGDNTDGLQPISTVSIEFLKENADFFREAVQIKRCKNLTPYKLLNTYIFDYIDEKVENIGAEAFVAALKWINSGYLQCLSDRDCRIVALVMASTNIGEFYLGECRGIYRWSDYPLLGESLFGELSDEAILCYIVFCVGRHVIDYLINQYYKYCIKVRGNEAKYLKSYVPEIDLPQYFVTGRYLSDTGEKGITISVRKPNSQKNIDG